MENDILLMILVLSTLVFVVMTSQVLMAVGWWLYQLFRVNTPHHRRMVAFGLLLLTVTGFLTALGVYVTYLRWVS